MIEVNGRDAFEYFNGFGVEKNRYRNNSTQGI